MISYRLDRPRYLEHGTPAWVSMWNRVRRELSERGLPPDDWFDSMLYRGTWAGEHHFTCDEGLSPDGSRIEFSFSDD